MVSFKFIVFKLTSIFFCSSVEYLDIWDRRGCGKKESKPVKPPKHLINWFMASRKKVHEISAWAEWSVLFKSCVYLCMVFVCVSVILSTVKANLLIHEKFQIVDTPFLYVSKLCCLCLAAAVGQVGDFYFLSHKARAMPAQKINSTYNVYVCVCASECDREKRRLDSWKKLRQCANTLHREWKHQQ